MSAGLIIRLKEALRTAAYALTEKRKEKREKRKEKREKRKEKREKRKEKRENLG